MVKFGKHKVLCFEYCFLCWYYTFINHSVFIYENGFLRPYFVIDIINVKTYLPNTGSVGALTSSSGGASVATSVCQSTVDQKSEEAKKEGKCMFC